MNASLLSKRGEFRDDPGTRKKIPLPNVRINKCSFCIQSLLGVIFLVFGSPVGEVNWVRLRRPRGVATAFSPIPCLFY